MPNLLRVGASDLICESMVALIPKDSNDAVRARWKNVFHKFSPESCECQDSDKIVLLAFVLHDAGTIMENGIVEDIDRLRRVFLFPDKTFDPLDGLFVKVFIGSVRGKIVSVPDDDVFRVHNSPDFIRVVLREKKVRGKWTDVNICSILCGRTSEMSL